MNSSILIALTASVVLGCSKQTDTATKPNHTNSASDLVNVSDNEVSFGYYKSSIIKSEGNVRVWLNMLKSNKESKKEVERISEILVDISCPLHQIKILKTADSSGQTISETSDDKWETPSPVEEMYKVILSVCNENSAQ